MKVGDLVYIVAECDDDIVGIGLYLGQGRRGSGYSARTKSIYKFLWKGRIATFDKPYWRFETINLGKMESNESRRLGKI